MSFVLPEALRCYVAQRVRELIEAGLKSGPGRALTPQRVAQLKQQALGKRR